jgi:hypothetical protein
MACDEHVIHALDGGCRMEETRRDEEPQAARLEAIPPGQRDDEHRNELARRRARQNRPSLTRNEQQERWPIG